MNIFGLALRKVSWSWLMTFWKAVRVPVLQATACPVVSRSASAFDAAGHPLGCECDCYGAIIQLLSSGGTNALRLVHFRARLQGHHEHNAPAAQGTSSDDPCNRSRCYRRLRPVGRHRAGRLSAGPALPAAPRMFAPAPARATTLAIRWLARLAWNRIMLKRARRFSGLEGVAGPAVTGPAHSVRDAAYAVEAVLCTRLPEHRARRRAGSMIRQTTLERPRAALARPGHCRRIYPRARGAAAPHGQSRQAATAIYHLGPNQPRYDRLALDRVFSGEEGPDSSAERTSAIFQRVASNIAAGRWQIKRRVLADGTVKEYRYAKRAAGEGPASGGR